MKQVLNFPHIKFATLFFAFAFVILFTSCENEDDEASSDINRVSMKTLPQLNYILGNTLDLTDMVITLDKGGKDIDIPFTSFEEEGITTEPVNGTVLDLSNTTVIVKLGDSGKGLIQTIKVTNYVTAVEVKNEPTKNYIAGQKLDLSDLVVTLTYQNGDKQDVSFSSFGEEISTAPLNGEILSTTNKTVSITHVETKINSEQKLTVSPFIPLQGELIAGPTKSNYAVGDLLNLKGIVIKYTLFNNSTVVVAFEDFAAFNLTSNPKNGAELKATDTQIKVSHIIGTVVKIPITVQ